MTPSEYTHPGLFVQLNVWPLWECTCEWPWLSRVSVPGQLLGPMVQYQTGAYTDLGPFTPEREAQGEGYWWKIPKKPTASDWVLVVKVLVPAKGGAG